MHVFKNKYILLQIRISQGNQRLCTSLDPASYEDFRWPTFK